MRPAFVSATIRPRLKVDTVQFNAEHILLPSNSMVEDLLKRLPGLQIDANGNITYNGEKIRRLLVDGEDIFASDPTLITRTFDADKVAQVEIIDRKADQATFTGVDDGSRTKTMNLVLKETGKNGYFGKAEIGGDPDKYFNSGVALAAFRQKEQVAALGLASNTGSVSFSMNGESGSPQINFSDGFSDPLGASAGDGIPHFEAAALHYSNMWNNLGNHLAVNYQYSHYFTQPAATEQIWQIEPDSIYGQFQKSRSTNQQDRHSVNAVYEWAAGQASVFRFAFHDSYTQGQNHLLGTGTSTFNDYLVNSIDRSLDDKFSQQNIGGDATFRIRVGNDEHRRFSLNFDAATINATTNGFIHSATQFYQNNGCAIGADTVDQRKQIGHHTTSVSGTINYTSPLWSGSLLELSYWIYQNTSNPFQASFSRGDGKYKDVIDSLSSDIQNIVSDQRATLNIQGKIKCLSYDFGNDWFSYRFHQRTLGDEAIFSHRYSNFLPRILLNYMIHPAFNIKFEYQTSTIQPNAEQLAPIVNDNDPLHIYTGNSALKPEFNQDLRLSFNYFKTWILNFNLNLTLIQNSISTKTTTDSLGHQKTEPVNVNGGQAAGTNLAISRKLFGVEAGFHVSSTYSNTFSYVNASLNRNNASSTALGLTLKKYVGTRFSADLITNFTYFDQSSSINTAAPIRYWTQNYNGSAILYINPHFVFGSNVTYTWQEKSSSFVNSTSVVCFNAFMRHNCFHDNLSLRLNLNNVFNQNTGIIRANAGNVDTQSSINVIGRYWMLSAIYHFDHKFKK